MAPWTFDVKFPRGTQFTFGSLTFAAGEDGDLGMLPTGSAPECLALIYGQAPSFPAATSTSGGAYSGLDPCEGCHICTVKLIQGILIMTSILRPSGKASSWCSSAASPDRGSSDDYPEIRTSTYGDSAREGRLIFMVPPTGEPSCNNSSRYPTIGRSEASDALDAQ
jgi:hypothetical protein